MKKLVSVFLCIITVIILFTTTAFAYNGQTSFEYRYPEAFEKVKKSFSSFSFVLNEELSDIPVPGNILSDIYSAGNGNTTTENMVAQGLCLTDDYILVSAYDSAKEYNSVIYIISQGEKHELLSTVVLPDKNHCGGLTTDGNYIYIAASNSGIVYFPVTELEKAAEKEGIYVLEKYAGKCETDVSASFVTYYDGVLWLGNFNEKSESFLFDYSINADGSLTAGETTYVMPEKLQGAAFFEKDSRTMLLASCSYGRTNISKVYIFDMTGSQPVKTASYVFPPMTEEVAVYDGVIYMIFESSSTEYSTKASRCPDPVDRIAALDIDKLTDTKTENKICDFFARIRSFFLKVFDLIASLFRKI